MPAANQSVDGGGGGLGRPKYNKQADSHWDRALALAVPVKQHKSDKTAAARSLRPCTGHWMSGNRDADAVDVRTDLSMV